MGRRNRSVDAVTAHRRFTTLQRDPTRKATRKYAREQPLLVDRIAMETILETYAIEANGLREVVYKDGRRAIRRDRRTKGNGLAAWIITQYEGLRKLGRDSAEALSMALDKSAVMAAVDSGEVGRWCERMSRGVIVHSKVGVSVRMDTYKDGPRMAGKKAKAAKWKEIGDAYRAGLHKAPRTSEGKTAGMVAAEMSAKLEALGIKV